MLIRLAAAAPRHVEGRTVAGTAVRYGELSRPRPGGYRFQFLPGSLRCRENAVLTADHLDEERLGLIDWRDTEAALEFSSVLAEGARQDQMIADLKAGLVGGASIEFDAEDARDELQGGQQVRVIMRGECRRVSLVTRQAMPGSRVSLLSAQDDDRRRRMSRYRAWF